MKIAPAFIFALLGSILELSTSAFACPRGTVFSAYQGNGLCLYAGKGLSVAAHCALTAGSCPKNMDRQQKGSDPEQCASVRTNVTPVAEANRVYYNCIALCKGSGTIVCPDNRQIKVGGKC